MRNRATAREDPTEAGGQETVEKVGSLRIAQPARGYRYGLDPFLLSGFIRPRLRERVVDLGTGCGILVLLLARSWPTLRVWGVELQAQLAGMAKENVLRNGFQDRCMIVEGDARLVEGLLPVGPFQRVVSNPPFRSPRTGRVSSHSQRAMARQELSLRFAELADISSRLLGDGGIFDFLHLPERLPEIIQALVKKNLEPKRLRFVHSFRDSPAELALVSARKGGRPGLDVQSPLVIYSSPGRYTSEARRTLGPGRGERS